MQKHSKQTQNQFVFIYSRTFQVYKFLSLKLLTHTGTLVIGLLIETTVYVCSRKKGTIRVKNLNHNSMIQSYHDNCSAPLLCLNALQ